MPALGKFMQSLFASLHLKIGLGNFALTEIFFYGTQFEILAIFFILICTICLAFYSMIWKLKI